MNKIDIELMMNEKNPTPWNSDMKRGYIYDANGQTVCRVKYTGMNRDGDITRNGKRVAGAVVDIANTLGEDEAKVEIAEKEWAFVFPCKGVTAHA